MQCEQAAPAWNLSKMRCQDKCQAAGSEPQSQLDFPQSRKGKRESESFLILEEQQNKSLKSIAHTRAWPSLLKIKKNKKKFKKREKRALKIIIQKEMRQGDKPKPISSQQPEGWIIPAIAGVLNFSCRWRLQTFDRMGKSALWPPASQSQTTQFTWNTSQLASSLISLNLGIFTLFFVNCGFLKNSRGGSNFLTKLMPSKKLVSTCHKLRGS